MDPNMIDRIFNRIYDDTYRKAAAYLTARCSRLSDVEDLLQETYLAVYRILSDRGADAFENEEAYVLSTAKSKLTDWYRRSGKDRAALTAPPADDDDTWLDAIPDDAPSPQELAEHREDARAVRALVDQKEPALQQAFYLHCCFGVSFPEIAKLQNRKEASVRSGVFRLTQELRTRLERSPL